MTTNLLSPTHIQKLGHPIDEIRCRALLSVASKYSLGLTDDTNLENTKSVLEKLFNWFSFDVHPHEEKVLKLIIQILKQKHAQIVVRELIHRNIWKKIDDIAKCINSHSYKLLDEIKICIKKFETTLIRSDQTENVSKNDSSHFTSQDLFVFQNASRNTKRPEIKQKNIFTSTDSVQLNRFYAIDKNGKNCHSERKSHSFIMKVEYFPWQPLALSDSQVITHVYDGLRYIDNINLIHESCQMYRDILLRIFPTEVFVQRPLLVQTLLELLHSNELAVSVPALGCLIGTVENLKTQFKFALNISLVHSKTFYSGPLCNFNEICDDVCDNWNAHFSLANVLDVEKHEDMYGIKLHQYTLPQMCIFILMQIIPHIGKEKSVQEYNLIFKLVSETFHLLSQNITSNFWSIKHRMRDDLYKVLNLFHEPLKYHKSQSMINHVIIVHIIMDFISDLKKQSVEELKDILPYCIQLELVEYVSHPNYVLLFPDLNSRILSFVQHCLGQNKKEVLDDYSTSLELCNSMKSAVEFSQRLNEFKTKIEKLSLAEKALPSLEFHHHFQFIHDVVKNCMLKWTEMELTENERKIRKNLIIKLLSHNDIDVKINVYKEILSYIMSHLGIEEVQRRKLMYPGNKFGFLFHPDVLNEMICYGLDSSQAELQSLSSEIFIHLLKGKIFFTKDTWEAFMEALRPCLPILQCFADKSTPLGRCILKMLDPDVSQTVCLTHLDLIRGNLRLLFSKNHIIREEALLRLFWLLTKEDPENKKLPRMNLLRGLDLSSICSSITSEEYSAVKHSFYSTESFCNVMEMLTANNLEPSIRRSALSQINVMLEDSHLHAIFIEQRGLDVILEIFKNCLIEKEFQNYPDSVVPIMHILKSLCIHNPSLRMQLSQDLQLYYCIIRGLLLFNSELRSRQNGVELLSLLLYHENIVNVLNEKAITSRISMPQILINRICLPFTTYSYGRCSKHAEPLIRDSVMSNDKSATLLRLHWNIHWLGGISQVLDLKFDDLSPDLYSPGLPRDMMLKPTDLEWLKCCSLTYAIKKTLFEIQNSTTHESVTGSLHTLNRYLILYEMERRKEEVEVGEEAESVASLKWQQTFERFLMSVPSCDEDDILLIHIIRILRFVLHIFKSSKDLVDWIEKLVLDETKTIPTVFKSHEFATSSFMRRELTRSVTDLVRDTISCISKGLSPTWIFYIQAIIYQLEQLEAYKEFNLVHIDWLTSVLMDVTGNLIGNVAVRRGLYEAVIIRVMELIVVLYSSKESQDSFLSMNIIKNCLHILNHVLGDTQATVKDWERMWSRALSRVPGHTDTPNYCWLLSLWFFRDPIVRALAVQLFVGFSVTCRGCECLIEQLNVEFEYLWNEGFKLLLDDSECNLVREKSASLLTNLTCHGSVATCDAFLQKLEDLNFYEHMCRILDSLEVELVREKPDSDLFRRYIKPDYDTVPLYMNTPSLISSVNVLLTNIMFLNPDVVSNSILESGLLESVTKVIRDAPDICYKYSGEESHILDLMKMYRTSCKLIAICMTTKNCTPRLLQQSQKFVSSLYCLVNHNLFNAGVTDVLHQRNRLWCEVLDLLSLFLINARREGGMLERCDVTDGFLALNQAMTENGTDHFISSLYLAVSSDFCGLRLQSLHFLTNLFQMEASQSAASQTSIADVFDRSLTPELVREAETQSWKGFVVSPGLDLNFATRVSDILVQTYHFCSHIEGSEFRTFVPEALGSLLAVCRRAQNHCLKIGLAEDLVKHLSAACITLSLEKIDSMKKASGRKRVEPVLHEIETRYQLLTHLFTENQRCKAHVAATGLSSIVNLLWHWCVTKTSIFVTVLKMLCTFTLDSDSASRSLALSKSWNITGAPKSCRSSTLLNTIIIRAEMEMDLTSTTKNSKDHEPLRLLFQILENCCRVSECRSLIAKSTLIQCINNHGQSTRSQSEGVYDVWHNFLIVFTSYQEGQLALAKNQDALDAVVSSTLPKFSKRSKALRVLRNICFHPLNRIQILSRYSCLSALHDVLARGRPEEVELATHAVWALTSNSQKGKTVLRNAGFDNVLKETKKKITLSDDSDRLQQVIDTVISMLKK